MVRYIILTTASARKKTVSIVVYYLPLFVSPLFVITFDGSSPFLFTGFSLKNQNVSNDFIL